MTNESIQTAIAKLMGWTDIRTHLDYNVQLKWLVGCPPNPHVEVAVPNYPTSLDACREFEQSLDYEDFNIYILELQAIVIRDKNVNWLTPHNHHIATALQKCEAYLRMHNQWIE